MIKRMVRGKELDMSTFVYGTGNAAKFASMRKTLEPLGLKINGLKELGVPALSVDENGKTPLENARIKAFTYYELLKRPVFACDSGLYIDGLPDNEQPGVHVRMVDGRRLNDDEMTVHYSAIAKRLGGKAIARYSNAICLVMGDGEVYEHFGDDISDEAFYIVCNPHPKRVEGFPLDCLSVSIQTGMYYYDGDILVKDIGIAPKGFREFFQRVLARTQKYPSNLL